jgi:hypothetical protein
MVALTPDDRALLAVFGRKWRLCVECGTPLGRRRKDAIYCGKRCGWRVRQRRGRERLRERPQIGVATRLLFEGVTSRFEGVQMLFHVEGFGAEVLALFLFALSSYAWLAAP